MVLPNASNISLANNGTHVTLGSKRLSAALAAGDERFNHSHEKYLGDLVTKFMEHFLPLFVGAYSAAPYRLGFHDFHPERVLSFLPYELDYTHLRMIWRRWKKKASLKLRPLGLRLTPFGPPLLDRGLAKAFGLRGDILPDFRLIDYMAAVMSTHQSPALDGRPGNLDRLKQDLAQLSVFDPRMPPYMLHRQREFAAMGFSGFEGRHYSLFESLGKRLGQGRGHAVPAHGPWPSISSPRAPWTTPTSPTTPRPKANAARYSSARPSACPPSSCGPTRATCCCG